MCRNYKKSELKIIENVKANNHLCFYCGRQLNKEERTVDHVQPLARGGKTEEENLVVCCEKCNMEKRDMTIMEYKQYLDKKNEFIEELDWDIAEQEGTLEEYRTAYAQLIQIASICNSRASKIQPFIKAIDNTLRCLKRQKEVKEKLFKEQMQCGRLNKKLNVDTFNKKLNIDVDNILYADLNNIIINSTIINSNIASSNVINSTVKDSNIL